MAVVTNFQVRNEVSTLLAQPLQTRCSSRCAHFLCLPVVRCGASCIGLQADHPKRTQLDRVVSATQFQGCFRSPGCHRAFKKEARRIDVAGLQKLPAAQQEPLRIW